ncbi:hypothetical protein [Pseudoalteromonas sp.]|uniref:hypothetical protein n=1 Tax=Pseudoalteromonas sp. TaxID=53249 RepID=UPI00356AD39E
MESSIHTHNDEVVIADNSNRTLDVVLIVMLSVLIIANGYLAHYASLTHSAFDATEKQVAFVVATTFGLPLVSLVTSLCFRTMRKFSHQIRLFTLTSAIVFVSNMPLLVLIF